MAKSVITGDRIIEQTSQAAALSFVFLFTSYCTLSALCSCVVCCISSAKYRIISVC